MKQTLLAATACLLLLAGCQDLAVENPNSPDSEIAFAQPGDVVNLVAGTFRDYWHGIQDCHFLMYSTIADENSSSWANWGMRDMSSEPRIAWDNSPTYPRRGSTEQPWFDAYRGISNANDALHAIARAEEDGSETDNIFTAEGYDTNLLKAFAKMHQGLMHGTLALIFDQAFVVDESVDIQTDELELKPYTEVSTEAIRILDEARELAAASDFSISASDDWIWGLDVDSDRMVRLINSFVARIMVQTARSPEERAAVDWTAVESRINDGITEDFSPIGDDDGNTEWDCMKFYGQEGTLWTRADYRTIGPADESGGWETWLATDLEDRLVFDIVSADRRVVGPDSVKQDGSDFEYQGNNGPFPPARGTYHYSSHNHRRYQEYYNTGANGAMPHMIMAEMDMYTAEGLLRTSGSTDDIAALINKTRVSRGMLNPATGSDPQGSSTDEHSHLDSASLWAKMKYERRIETFQTGGGLAWFDDRGMGDLVKGTPIHFPVPGKELETLGLPNYTFGGVGGEGGAPTPFRDTDIDFSRIRR